jgi:hypothetical protein
MTGFCVNYTFSEPSFDQPLPEVCPRKPNFVTPWYKRTLEDGDKPGYVFDYFERHTNDGLSYIVYIEPSRKET